MVNKDEHITTISHSESSLHFRSTTKCRECRVTTDPQTKSTDLDSEFTSAKLQLSTPTITH